MPSRRGFLAAAAVAGALPSLLRGEEPAAKDVDRELLELARSLESKRRQRFVAVKSRAEAEELQSELRAKFLAILDGLPKAEAPPPARVVDRIEGDGYTIDKLIYQSLPDYHVPALLYLPAKIEGKIPGVISPCGHSTTGKAADSYQVLHINLARRGIAVLTYDPVGQGERSQFWDTARKQSKYNLTCGEHAVLGNPLYLLGTSLARYRIWDGLRALDYLASLPLIDPARLGCAGNSGGGTLSAYISALDPRVKAAVISCYITTLPRRMANRIEADPDSDPEQDIFGFVSAGIDHAGLLALRAPRPTLVCSAQFDFFPIEGAKESVAEAQAFFAKFGAADRVSQAIAQEKHGLTLPLRQATYAFFDRWLLEKPANEKEIAVKPRSADELQVCPEGQVNVTHHSRHLFSVAAADFRRRPPGKKQTLQALLRLEGESAEVHLRQVAPGREGDSHALFVDGNESPSWERDQALLDALARGGWGVTIASPRGVGPLRSKREVKGQAYEDPLCGVEENLAYNAFLLGRSLLAMRVHDVASSIAEVRQTLRPKRLALVARGDAGIVAMLAAALEPAITHLALEGTLLSYWSLFRPDAAPLNAASLLPGMLRDYGDLPEVLGELKNRAMLLATPRGRPEQRLEGAKFVEGSFAKRPSVLVDWLGT